MSDEQDQALLTEIVERQKTLQAELADFTKGQAQALEKYARSDIAYRDQLESYRKEQEATAIGRKVAMAIRLVALLLLLFIAYRIH